MKRRILPFIFLLFCFSFSYGQQTVKCKTYEQIERVIQAKKNHTTLAVSIRPALQTSILSPGGKFRIHFDTAGVNQPAMVLNNGTRIANTYGQYVDTVANILDAVWKTEIDTFGFMPPPSDNNKGGGNELDVYISELGGGVFGYTEWDDDNALTPGKTNPQYSSFFHIDNDYGAGYRTKGILAVLATCAHEFHHTIQIGNSGIWYDDFSFYEICAESMESTVFPSARDYLFDVKTYYDNISTIPLFLKQNGTYRGYDRAIFGIFMMKRYGKHFMQDVWNEIRTYRPVHALQNAFEKKLSSLQREYSEYSLWNYYSGDRADTVKYFPDAKLFPKLNFYWDVSLSSQSITISQNVQSFTASYIQAVQNYDTTHLIIANTNYADASNYLGQTFSYIATLSNSPMEGSTEISPSLYSTIAVADKSNWNIVSFYHGSLLQNKDAQAFPSPFNPLNSTLLISPENLIENSIVLSIFSSSMDLVLNNPATMKTYLGKNYVIWNGKDTKGVIVPSGVYFYVLSDDRTVLKGKIAVIR